MDYLAPSLSFPDAGDGFVLAPVAGTPALPNRPVDAVTMALVATSDAGHSWHILYRFPWRPLRPGEYGGAKVMLGGLGA